MPQRSLMFLGLLSLVGCAEDPGTAQESDPPKESPAPPTEKDAGPVGDAAPPSEDAGDAAAPVPVDPFREDRFDENCTDDWLACTNYFRSMSGVAPITEDPSLTKGVKAHANYCLQNSLITHDEVANKPGYTAEGAHAGTSSVVTGSYVAWKPGDAIVSWMQAPFHAAALLDPRFPQGAYGDASSGSPKDTKKLVFSAALNTNDRFDWSKSGFPIVWPGDHTRLSHHYFYGESPSPLSACPGYKLPTGIPILAMLGNGDSAVGDVTHSLTSDGEPVEHCEIDEANYTNPDAAGQKTGRSILQVRNMVLLIPKKPLLAGRVYEASVSGAGQKVSWTFRVSDHPRDYAGISLEGLRKSNP